MNDDLTSKSAIELTQLIRTREASSVETVEAYLRRIEQVNPSINAIVTIATDVIERARGSDEEVSRGRIAGPLHGLPITVKDTVDTEGIRTTYGSRAFAQHIPVQDAVVVARLKAAGAIILGKTNTPEMAIPYETDNPVFGRTNNPHDAARTAGGSSGGEAAAIAALLSPAGVGSDLSGSIRVPAHFCGIAGLKPTSGLVSMEGHVPRALGPLSLGAAIGPMARCVKDLDLLFQAMIERSENRPADNNEKGNVSVAWFADNGVAPVAGEIATAAQRAADILRDAGFNVRQETPPGFTEGQRLWVELFSAAAAEEIRDRYGGHEHEAGPLVAPVLRPNGGVTRETKLQNAETLAKALMERERYREGLLQWMRATPLIISPVSATAAFEHGATRVWVGEQSISIFRSCSYSQAVNVFGLPAVVVPVARTEAGLPLGVQVIGRPAHEKQVLDAALVIERAAEFW